jgi:cell division protein FtsZ
MTNSKLATDKELESVLGMHKTRIRIVGAGGAGNNTVTRLLEVGIKDVDVIAINTDAQDLLFSKATQKVLIGRTITKGLGTGSDPEKGEDSAKESTEEIEEHLSGSDMVFITCGLGGGTGTGSVPVIAEIAKKVGALTIAVVTLPFSDEGIIRWDNARKGLEKLQRNVDTVIVVQNDRLLELVPDMPLNAAFKVADEILVNAVKGITELVTEKGLVNLDFADVRTIMENGGVAMIGLGESDSENKAEEAAQKAIQNPLLDIDITGAKNALINITGGQDMSLNSAKTIMKIVSDRLDPSAKIIWGARLDETMNHSIRVMLIVTSLKSTRRSAMEIDMAIKSTEQRASKELSSKKSLDKIQAKESEHSEKINKPGKKKSSKVFSELFLEEAQADLIVLGDAINGLAIGNRQGNEKYLREIKNACSSLYNTAELFSFKNISGFAELIGELTERALKGEFELSENFLRILREIPSSAEALIAEKDNSDIKVEEITKKLSGILELLKNSQNQDISESLKTTIKTSNRNDIFDSHKNKIVRDQSNQMDVQAEKLEAKKPLKDKESSESEPDNGKPNFSNVDEAVKFIKKLF